MDLANAESLGAFTEEVMETFDAVRFRKSETKMHWHEFIAAGFSHCKVDYSCNNKLICFNFVVDIIFIYVEQGLWLCCRVLVCPVLWCFMMCSCTVYKFVSESSTPSLGGSKLAPPEFYLDACTAVHGERIFDIQTGPLLGKWLSIIGHDIFLLI